MSDPTSINMVDPQGGVHEVPLAQVDAARMAGFHPETPEENVARVAAGVQNEQLGTGKALVAGIARGVTLGGSDALLTAIGGSDQARHLRALRDANPIASTIGDVGGTVAAGLATGGRSALASTPAGLAARAGRAVTALGEGAGVAGRIGAAAAGGAIEGALYGVGQGVSELALSDDPVTWERATSVLSSHALFGGATGGLAGGAAKGIEVGLSKARSALAKGVEARAAAESVPAELATLDRKGLAAAHEAEVASIKAARATERSAIADELAAFRRETEASKPWLSIKGLTDDVIGKEADRIPIQEIAAMTKKADTRIRTLLNNPAALADNVAPAKVALQAQEHALESLLAREPAVRAAIAADTTGARAAALDAVPAVLERNRALQARIADISGDLTSPRLQQIATAKEVLADAAGRPKSMGEQMLTGIAFGKAAAGVGAVAAAVGTDNPVGMGLGLLAPIAGAKASKYVAEKVFGRVAKASAEAAARQSAALDALMNASAKVSRAAPVLATKVLEGVRYAPAQPDAKASKPDEYTAPEQKGTALAKAFKARSEEIRSQVETAPTGQLVMRQDARAQVAANLTPVAALAPVLADRMETIAVRGLEFLASMLPKRPSVGGMQLGPDLWQPSDMQMRQFARYAAAVEDPHAIVERLADGSVTPEDAEVMRAVYPEMMADITRQIVERLPQLTKQLPYQRRVALSIFSGVPVDPAMSPEVLSSLQANFPAEPNTDGGTHAPTPQPQFGSVRSADKPTPAQSRAAGGAV